MSELARQVYSTPHHWDSVTFGVVELRKLLADHDAEVSLKAKREQYEADCKACGDLGRDGLDAHYAIMRQWAEDHPKEGKHD